MLSFFKKDKNKAQDQSEAAKAEEQYTELKSKQSEKDAEKKKSTVCCGSCGGSGH